MSVADTAEYQLESLATTLDELADTPALVDDDPKFRAGWQAALDAVAKDMGLTVTVVHTYRYL